MSDSYTNILEGLEQIIEDLESRIEEFGGAQHIAQYLSILWLGEDPSIELTYRGETRTMKSLADEFSRGSMKVFLDSYPKTWNNPKLGMRWLNNPPKNWDRIDIITDFYKNTVLVIKLLLIPQYRKDVIKNILNIFFRLTNYSNGAIVSIRDLIDYPTAKFLTERMGLKSSINQPLDEYPAINAWASGVQGILFSLETIGVKLPAPFNVELSILEREDTLQQTIIELENAFRKSSDKKTNT